MCGCDSTAWATQLRLLSSSLLEKFRTELGDGVVTRIQVLGPAAPSWRKGGRRQRPGPPGHLRVAPAARGHRI